MKCAVATLILSLLAFPLFADYQVFYENGKAGIRDEAGNILIPATFDALGWSDGSFSVLNSVTGYRRESRWGLINLKKELITQPEYENLTSGGGDRVVASRWINPYTKKFGCIDLYGNVTVPFHYDAISILGLRAIACVKNGTRYEFGLIDLGNKTILKIAYRDIRPVGSLRFAVQNFERKTALFTEEGAPLTGFDIDSISTFRKGYALIYQNLKVGLLDRFGEIVVAPSYQQIRIADDGTTTAKPFAVWKEVNAGNRELRQIIADSLRPAGKQYVVSRSGFKGTVDANFNGVIDVQYSSMTPFVNHLAVATRNGKAGVIRDDGKIVIPFEHDSLSMRDNFVRSFQLKSGQPGWAVYDTFGIKKTERSYDKLYPFNGRFFPARRMGFWGAVDRYGKELMACVYDSLINFSPEYTAVKFKGLYGIVDRDEKWILPPQLYPVRLVNDNLYFQKSDSILFVKDFTGQIIYFTNNPLTVLTNGFREITSDGNIKFITWQGISSYESAPPSVITTERVFEESEGYRGVERDGRFGFIDQRGRLRVANRYEGIGKFKQGLAPVKILGKWGFVNTEDRIVVNPNYERVTEFERNVSIVTRNGHQGVISPDGKVILPIRYDSIRLSGEKLVLLEKGKAGLADLNGQVLIEPRFNAIRILPGALVMVSDDRHWGVTTDDGLPVIPMIYDALCYNEMTGNFLVREDQGWVAIKP